MNDGKLVSMANQIATFFRSYPEEEARAGIRGHLKAFWTPGMCDTILAEGPHEGLDPLVAAALLEWPRAESPVSRETSGPAPNGQLASDAG